MTSWNPPMIANVNGHSVGLTGSENLCVCVFSECRNRLNFPFIRLLSTLLSILHHIHHHVPSVCPVDSQGCSACCCPGTDRRPHPCRLPPPLPFTHYTTELALFTLIRKIPFGKLCLRQLRARGGGIIKTQTQIQLDENGHILTYPLMVEQSTPSTLLSIPPSTYTSSFCPK